MRLSRFVVIGGGSIGKRHINNLLSLGYQYVACFHHRLESKISIKNVEDLYSWDEVEKWTPDAILICSPTNKHLEVFDRIKNINFHIFMEKPLTSNSSLFKDLILNNKVFMIGFMLRYHTQIQQIKKIIKNKNYGRIIKADFEFGSYLPNWHPNKNYKKSYVSNHNMGGGVINTIAHEIDLICWFFGFPNTVFTQYSGSDILKINVEESCDSIFGYKNFNVTLHLDLLQKSYNRSINIYFEDASIKWNWKTNIISINPFDKKEKKIKPKSEFDVNNLYYDEIADFISKCENNKVRNELNLPYAKKNQHILNEMHNSNRKKKYIELKFNGY